jgi:hypothetical protein
MADAPIVPAAPTVPAAPVQPAAAKVPEVAPKGIVDTKAPITDKGAADKIKTDTAAEKVVIQKIKVGDVEYDETTLKNMIEKAKGADKKFLEAAQARKEAMRFFKMAKENPREFLEKTGLDPKKFAYEEVAQDIKDKLRDPKEVELEKAQARLKEFEAKEAAEKDRIQQEKLAKQAKAIEERFHAQAIAALEKHPAIPKNAFSVAKMAKYIEVVHQKTGELLSFEDVAGVIEADIRGEVSGLVKGASAEQLIALIGEEGVAALRAYDLARLKDPLKGGAQVQADGTKPKEKQKRWASSNDFWKTIDKAAKAEKGE